MDNKRPELQPHSAAPAPRVLSRQIIAPIAALLVVAVAVPFLSAGSFDWPAAWAYVAITLIVTVGSRLILIRRNPELAAERAAYAHKADAKP